MNDEPTEKKQFTRADIEKVLRDAGVPRRMAKSILANGWQGTESTSEKEAQDLLALVRAEIEKVKTQNG